MLTLEDTDEKPQDEPTSVIQTVMGSNQCIQTKSMKQGISLEHLTKGMYN